MTEVLSAESIIANLSGQIDFEWVAVQDDSDLPSHTINSSQHATLVGHLNLVHKNLIQVIGATECEYLQGLEESFRKNMLDEIFSANPAAIIMADGIPVPDMLITYANNYQTPLLSCKTDSNEVVDLARRLKGIGNRVCDVVAGRTTHHTQCFAVLSLFFFFFQRFALPTAPLSSTKSCIILPPMTLICNGSNCTTHGPVTSFTVS